MKAVSLVDVVVILVPLGRRSGKNSAYARYFFQTFSSRPLPARDSSASGRECLCSKRGVTLSLIAQPEGQTDLSLSYQAREAALAAICAAPHDEPSIAASSVGSERAAAAIALAATLDDEADLSPGETGLLQELLQRLATAPATPLR